MSSLLMISTITLVGAVGPQAVAGSNCQICHQDYVGGLSYHWFENDEGEGAFTCGGTDGGCHKDMIRYFCDVNHNPCGEFAAALSDFESVLTLDTARDPEGALQLLAKHPENAVLNVQRRSIQLLDCNQSVAAMIALEPSVLRAMVAAD